MGNAVADQMHRARVNQTELTKKLGWHQTTLSKKIRGANAWSLSDVIEIADALEIDAVVLLQELWGYVPAPQKRGSTNLSLLCGSLNDDTMDSVRRPVTNQ
jgi:hypothetical protein